jgi:hypothetical protein
MILHIIDDEKFLSATIVMFETIFPGSNIFLVGTGGVSYNNISKLGETTRIYAERANGDKYEKQFKKQSQQAELILFHNLYKPYKLRILNKTKKLAKTAWTFWGAELYGLNPGFEALLPKTKKYQINNLGIKKRLKQQTLSKIKKYYYWYLLKKLLKSKKVDYTLTNLTEDIILLENAIDYKLQKGWFTYFSFDKNQVPNIPKNPKQHILIGNSSSATNNHIDIFELLKTRDFINRKIYIPLSYGDFKYRELVVKRAKNYFQDSSTPLQDFLSKEDYNIILNSCSTVIMNHTRQQAFNTIMGALSMGCKVYLREENTIFKMLKREGFIVFSIQKDLENKDCFEPLSEQFQIHNRNLLQQNYSKEVVYAKIKNELKCILDEQSQ